MSDSDYHRRGVHWRLDREGATAEAPDDREVGLDRVQVCALRVLGACAVPVPIYVAHVRPLEDGNHPWGGLMPFSHFEPGQYERACRQGERDRGAPPSLTRSAPRAAEFIQPSTWVLLQKSPEQLKNPLSDRTGAGTNTPALLDDDGALHFRFSGAPSALRLDDSRKNFPGFSTGLTSLSRGQVYYHRPGNWTEQPNFFNPYWRPRLASIYQGRYSLPLVDELARALPPQLAPFPHKVLTH